MSNLRLKTRYADQPVALDQVNDEQHHERSMPRFGLPEAKTITHGISASQFVTKTSPFYCEQHG